MTRSQREKIRRVYPQSWTRTVQGQPRTYGPYWIGAFDENGRTQHVHIGKKLPRSLKRLLQGKYKPEGSERYRWPRSQGYNSPTPKPAKE